uniref:Uncharacterized protein n=2 Tax=Oryza TaxID=4527 RepID=A0A0D3H0V1_9ORYZ
MADPEPVRDTAPMEAMGAGHPRQHLSFLEILEAHGALALPRLTRYRLLQRGGHGRARRGDSAGNPPPSSLYMLSMVPVPRLCCSMYIYDAEAAGRNPCPVLSSPL